MYPVEDGNPKYNWIAFTNQWLETTIRKQYELASIVLGLMAQDQVSSLDSAVSRAGHTVCLRSQW